MEGKPPSKRVTRWTWQDLAQARTREEFLAVLAQLEGQMGEEDLEVKVSIPPKEYIRLMGNAWLAYRYGEIKQLNIANIIDRALQVYAQYLKEMAVRRRRSM